MRAEPVARVKVPNISFSKILQKVLVNYNIRKVAMEVGIF